MIGMLLLTILTIFLYILLCTTIVLELVMGGIALWWWRRAASPLAFLSLLMSIFFIGYAVHIFLRPTFIEVLILALLVVFSLEVVMESAGSRQTPN